MANYNGRRGGGIREATWVSGYILPDDPSSFEGEDDASDDGGGDFDDDVDFGDEGVFDSAATILKSKCLKFCRVKIKEHGSNKVHEISGCFPMVDPWWDVSMYVKGHRLVGYPKYSIRTDDLVGKQGVVMLFLKHCKVEDEHRMTFYDYLKQRGLSEQLGFGNLRDLLAKFAERNEGMPEDIAQRNEQISKNISSRIDSGEGLFVMNCMQFRLLSEVLPQLLPKHFHRIMILEKGILSKIERLLKQSPWMFGFSWLLNNHCKIYGCEASFKNFYQCLEIFDKLSDNHKDSLYIYGKLKDICRRYGHTFVSFNGLKSYHGTHLPEYKVTDWKQGLEFLEDREIIKREQMDKNIYLFHYWIAEKEIVEHLERLMFADDGSQLKIDIDFESHDFDLIRTDEDQVKAAELIASKPVVVLSGKGGCGKTEVVARVFGYAKNVWTRKHELDSDDESDAECEMSLSLSVEDVQEQDAVGQSVATEECCVIKDQKSDHCSNDQKCLESGDQQLSQLTRQCTQHDIAASSSRQETKWNAENFILLTAPTGKAASLLGQRSGGMKGYTLHQVVYSHFTWKRNSGGKPWKFASVRVLIVDESSLVPVTIFRKVLRALTTAAKLCKVILLGDDNQLPSIEPGQFLLDMYEALKEVGCSVTLRTNHRSESAFIVQNADYILQCKTPTFDSAKGFHLHDLNESGDNERDTAVKALLKSEVLPSHEHSQFVSFTRKDCVAINEVCCVHYNQHSIKKRGPKGGQISDFRVGDKVCCTRNAYVTDYSEDRKPSVGEKDPEIRLCNGEIFFIKYMHEVQERERKLCYVTLSNATREVRVSLNDLKSQCKLKHAWARTIHTFQGSETDAVVYVVGSNTHHQNRQHVYTAITRGRKQVHVVAETRSLGRVVKQMPKPRNTSLKARLIKMLKTNGQVVANSAEHAGVTPLEENRQQAGNTPVCGDKRKSDMAAIMTDSPSNKQVKAEQLVTPMKRKLSFKNDDQ